jgi:hypothetical protein
MFCKNVSANSFDFGKGVVFFKNSYPLENEKSTSVDIFDSTLNHKITVFNCYPFYLNNPDNDDVLIEFANEVYGIGIEEIFEDKIKVIIGRDLNENLIYGWIPKSNKKIDYLLWSDLLPKRVLFFIHSPYEFDFRSQPDGEKVEVELFKLDNPNEYSKVNAVINFDYDMYSIHVDGNWMLVEISSPGDFCSDQVNDNRIKVWIRYLDDRGRPLVWFFPRGC